MAKKKSAASGKPNTGEEDPPGGDLYCVTMPNGEVWCTKTKPSRRRGAKGKSASAKKSAGAAKKAKGFYAKKLPKGAKLVDKLP